VELETVLTALEKVPELLESNRKIENLLTQIVEALPVREYFDAGEVCSMLGVSPDQARAKPFLLPNYGQSDFPGRVKKWLPATVHVWLKVAPIEHERAWKMLTDQERRRILRGAA